MSLSPTADTDNISSSAGCPLARIKLNTSILSSDVAGVSEGAHAFDNKRTHDVHKCVSAVSVLDVARVLNTIDINSVVHNSELLFTEKSQGGVTLHVLREGVNCDTGDEIHPTNTLQNKYNLLYVPDSAQCPYIPDTRPSHIVENPHVCRIWGLDQKTITGFSEFETETKLHDQPENVQKAVQHVLACLRQSGIIEGVQ